MADELRQAMNKIDITGVVKEHNLNSGKTEEGKKYINGNLTIKAGEFTEITIKVFTTEKNSKNKIKKTYENLKKILDGEVRTMAETSEEEAVKVRLWGNNGFAPQFKEEIFKAEEAVDVITKTSIDLGFGNLIIDNKIGPEDYRASFDVEMFVESVDEELDKNEEETGRVIVKGWVPVYGGTVVPLELKAGIIEDEEGEFDFAEEIRNNIDPESTVNFWGEIDFKTIIEKKEKGGSMGRAKIDESRTYVHDLVAVGAEFVADDDVYEIEDIQKAIVVREGKKQEIANKADSEEKGKKSSRASRGRTAARNSRVNRQKNNSVKNSEVSVDEDEEIPF